MYENQIIFVWVLQLTLVLKQNVIRKKSHDIKF